MTASYIVSAIIVRFHFLSLLWNYVLKQLGKCLLQLELNLGVKIEICSRIRVLLFFNVSLEGRSVVLCMCLHELGIQNSGFPEVPTELWLRRGAPWKREHGPEHGQGR